MDTLIRRLYVFLLLLDEATTLCDIEPIYKGLLIYRVYRMD